MQVGDYVLYQRNSLTNQSQKTVITARAMSISEKRTSISSQEMRTQSAETYFTVDDVETTLEYLNRLRKAEHSLSPETQNKKISYLSYITDKRYELLEESFQEGVDTVISAWLENREGFLSIFSTEHGSLYFVLKDGQTVRFKQKQGKWDKNSQIVIMDHIFYLPEQTFKDFAEAHLNGYFQDYIQDFIADKRGFPAQEKPEVGFHPFEFRLHEYANDISFIYEPKKGQLRITGESGPFASGYHLGHSIHKIHKENDSISGNNQNK